MANYNETDVTGTEWQRCYGVSIANPLEGPKFVQFAEERVFNLTTGQVSQCVAGCQVQYEPAAQFDVLDPSTGQPTGQKMTHAELYKILYSLYMDTASKRDNAGA